MAKFRLLRSTRRSANVEGFALLGQSSPVRARTAAALTAAALFAILPLAAVPLLGSETTDRRTPTFLTEALGSSLAEAFGATRAEAPMIRRAAPGINVEISPTGFGAVSDGRPIGRAPKFHVPSEEHHHHDEPHQKSRANLPRPPSSSISLAAEGVEPSVWKRYANGASRATDFGRQTVVIGKAKIEEFLTVHDHHGLRTWRWRIGAPGLTPRMGDDGSVGFLLSYRVIDLYIEPVRILDARGQDVTPTGLTWSLAKGGGSRWLELRLEDSGLPLPYVIDPGIAFRSATGSNNGAGATSLSLTMPASVAANDLLLAQVSVRGTPTITPPAGWTLIRTDTHTSGVIGQALYYRQATSGEPASYSWSLSVSGKASGGILAYAGVDLTAPINADGGATGASGITTTPSITATVANTMVVAFFAKATLANNFNVSNEVILRHKGASSGGSTSSNVTSAAGDVTQAGAGATGAKTINSSNCTAREWVGQIVALRVDATPPSAPAQSISESGPDSHASGSTFFYRPAGAGGSFTVTSTTSDGESGLKQVRFPAVSVGMTPTAPVDDTTSPYSQVYTWATGASESGAKTVTASDGADNTSTGTFTITRDSAAPPAPAATFPAAGSSYNTAGWNGGCPAAGFCGTNDPDADSGLGQVEISVRQDGTGNYWDGTSFGSASEVFQLAGGTSSWSYEFPVTNFPTDGAYTIQLRATDNVSNAATSSTIPFTFDATSPSGSLTAPAGGATVRGTSVAVSSDSADATSGVAQAEFQRSPAGAGTWTTIGSPDATSPYSVNWDTTAVADGLYDLRAITTDAAGNAFSSPTVANIRVDNTVPSSTTSFPASSGSYSTAGWETGCATVGFCGTYSDGSGSGVAAVELSIRQASTGNYWNGLAFAATSETFVTASLSGGNWSYAFGAVNFPADGDYIAQVRATDSAGNAETGPSRTFRIDNANPSALFTFPAAGEDYSTAGWNGGCATVGFCGTHSDSGSGVQAVEISIQRVSTALYWDGSSFTSGSETFFAVTLSAENWSYAFAAADFPADGEYTVHVHARDNAANTEAGPSRTFRIDTTSPSTTMSFPAAGAGYNAAGWTVGCATVGFCGTYSDGSGAGVQAVELSIRRGAGDYWDGSSFASGSEVWNLATLSGGNWSYLFPAASFPADGSYTIRVRGSDNAGNAEAPASRTFSYDTTSPSAIFSFPAASASYNASGWDTGCAPTGLCGTHSDATSAVSQVEVSIQRVSTALYWDGSSFGAAVETFMTATLSGGNWSHAFPVSSFPAEGDYVVRVRATDSAGNTATGPNRTFAYDTVAPNTAIDSGPGDPTSTTSASFSFSAGEPGSSFECDLDGAGFSACTSPKSYSGLTDGSHTFEVRATDAANNPDPTPATYAWLVDSAAPTSTASFPAASGSYNTAGWNAGCPTAGFCGTYSDGAGSGVQAVEISIRQGAGNYWDGASFASASEVRNTATLSGGTWSYAFATVSFPANGTYTVRVRATDNATNAETPASRTFTYDTAAPLATIDSGPANPTSSTSASFSFTSGEAGSIFQCELDGEGFAACTSPTSYTGLVAGNHTFEVRATDPAGNTDPTPASYTWTIDLTDPQTTITAGPSDPSNDTAPSFTFTSSEAASSFECNLDGGAFAPCTSPEPYTGLTEGSHTFEVKATDAAGNVDPSAAAYTWTIDLTDPQTTITAGPSDPSNDTAPSFTFTSSEAASSFECNLDGGAFAPCTSPEPYTGLVAGSHTFEVRATDPAGNTDPTPASYAWTIDAMAPPAPSINPPSPVAGSTTGPAVEFYFSDSEAGVSFSCALDGGAFASCTSPKSYTGLASGSHTFEVEATDAAGNDSAVTTRTWNVNVAPETAISTSPSDPSNDPNPSFTFTSSEAGSTFECNLDASEFEPCASPKSYTGLSAGSHTFEARATDVDGSTDPTPASYTWTIDVTAPHTTIDSSPPNPTTSSSATFQFSASEAGSSFECDLDGAGFSPCTSPTSHSGLTDGSHTFEVRASDAADNTDPTPASYTWLVDAAAPTSTASFPASTSSYNTAAWNAGCATAGFCGTYSDGTGSGVQTIEISIRQGAGNYWDGTSFASASEGWNAVTFSGGSWSYAFPAASFPATGSHTVRMRATDNVANTETPLSRTFAYDAAGPSRPGSFRGENANGRLVLRWSGSTDDSGLIESYLVYANGVQIRAVAGTATSVDLGLFKTSDSRSFRLAARDAAGSVSAQTYALRIVPALRNLTLSRAKSRLSGRGLKTGKVSYVRSSTIARGRVVKAGRVGVVRQGTAVPLTVSSGSA